RDLDLRLAPVPWGISRESFWDAIREAVQNLSPSLRALVSLDEVFIGDVPGVEVIVEGADPRTPVLLDSLEGSTAPLRVFVYQRNVERICGSAERVTETIQSALEREIAGAAFGELEAPSAEQGTLN